jgi:hypothetical protein
MRYYVRTIAQSVSGDRGVHESTCSRLPNPENRLYLGDFPSCSPAVRKAIKPTLTVTVAIIVRTLVPRRRNARQTFHIKYA